MNIRYEDFYFLPNHTIHAVLKYKNGHVLGEKLEILKTLFNEKNGTINPRPGQKYQIPILEE